jgi:hypothetical protein
MPSYASCEPVSSVFSALPLPPPFSSLPGARDEAMTRHEPLGDGRMSRLATCEFEPIGSDVPAPLVYTQNHATPPPSESPVFRRVERFALQSVSRLFLPDERVSKCLRVPTCDHVAVKHNPVTDSYGYRNLETCASVWVCPVCQAKISEKRRAELCEGVLSWKDRGGNVLLLTLTVRHKTTDSYSKSLDGLVSAYRKFLNRRTGKSLFSIMGVQGRIRALESTYGANGWHPHFHVLLFIKDSIPADLVSLHEKTLSDLWRSACLSSGLAATNSHGCTLKDGSAASQYITKWGLEEEITKSHIKKSKENYSPNDLLRFELGTYSGTALPLQPGQARVLFRDYAYTMKGKRQLVWSDGLRDLLGLRHEKSDSELIDEVEDQEILFVRIPNSMWKVILSCERRAEVLESCRLGIDNFFSYCKSIWLDYQTNKQEASPCQNVRK